MLLLNFKFNIKTNIIENNVEITFIFVCNRLITSQFAVAQLATSQREKILLVSVNDKGLVLRLSEINR